MYQLIWTTREYVNIIIKLGDENHPSNNFDAPTEMTSDYR